MPADLALDVAHSLLVDLPDGMVDRVDVMERLDLELHKPFGDADSDEVVEYMRERWGTSSEAMESEARFGVLDGITFGEDPD